MQRRWRAESLERSMCASARGAEVSCHNGMLGIVGTFTASSGSFDMNRKDGSTATKIDHSGRHRRRVFERRDHKIRRS